MRTSRRIKVTAGFAIMAVVGGLIVWTAPSATSLPQIGQNNYWGPGPCPPADASPGEVWNCNIASGDIEGAEQFAPTGGRNVFECDGATCDVKQHGTTEEVDGVVILGTPKNEASCSNSTSDEKSEQLCQVAQQGGSNEITADFEATPNAGANLDQVDQQSEQRFYTTQSGDTNVLTVNGTITQLATANLDVTVPITHKQNTLQRANNEMTATTSNVVNYNLHRTQESSAIGATPKQFQDVDPTDATNPDGATLGLGEIHLKANSAATNAIVVEGIDSKVQNGTSLVGDAAQGQGHGTGGWLTTLEVETGLSTSDPDVVIGNPGTEDPADGGGLQKLWVQHAEVLPGASKSQTQDDGGGIKIPIIGSAKNVRTNEHCNLETDEGGHIVANWSADGFAGQNWTGRIHCTLKAGNKTANPETVNFNQQGRVHKKLFCEVNSDDCPGGLPDSHPHMAVRNVRTDPDFAVEHPLEPAQTSAEPGDTVEYAATFHNTGAGTASGATLSGLIPEGTTFVEGSCSDTCTAADGKVSFATLPDVPSNTSVVRRFSLQINPMTPAGTLITNRATGDQDGSSGSSPSVDSDDTTVTVVEPPPPPVKTARIEFPQQPIKKSSGVFPIWILTAPDDGDDSTVDDATELGGATVCVGDNPPDGGNPTPGTQPPGVDADCTESHSVVHLEDADNDGDIDVVFHFDAVEAGFEQGDTVGYLTGRTHDGTAVEGQAPIRTR